MREGETHMVCRQLPIEFWDSRVKWSLLAIQHNSQAQIKEKK